MHNLLASLALVSTVGQGTFQPINHVPLPADRPDFSFVVLGDNRPAGAGQPPTAIFRHILGEVAAIHPDFILSTGDLMYGNEEPMEVYRSECDQMSQLLSRLKVPFFNSPGNHEIADRPEFEKEYRSRFGELYGSFDFGGFRFLAVCTEELGHSGAISDTQRTWIRSKLDGKPAFVYMHHPVFARQTNTEAKAIIADNEGVNSDFASGKVRAVFEGHDHVFNHQTHGAIEYYIGGGAGAPLDAPPTDGGFFHYLLVQVKSGQVTITVMPFGSIDIVSVGDDIRVCNYSDVDLILGDVAIPCAKSPTSVQAMFDKKGKMTDVAATLVSVDKVDSGFIAHIALPLTKHRQTIVRLH